MQITQLSQYQKLPQRKGKYHDYLHAWEYKTRKKKDTFSKVHSELSETSKMELFRKQLMAESC